jgi:hypothetical protein
MRKTPLQRLAASCGGVPHPEKWVFVIGCYNSGTTLLAGLLERHSQIQSLPGEGVVFTDELTRPEEFGWPRLWFKCRQQMKVRGANPADLAGRIKRQWRWAAIGKGPCFLEKSIANATRLEFLNDHFQPAYFIHIMRNGYAVAEGIQRKADPTRWRNPEYSGRYPIGLCAEQWQATEALITAQSSQLDNYYALSYEDLTAAPEQEIRRILQFLELPDESQLLNKEIRVHGQRRPISNLNDLSLRNLGEDDIEAIDRVAKDWLDRYGYRSQG